MMIPLPGRKSLQDIKAEALILNALDGAGGAPRLTGLIKEDPKALVMEFCSGIHFSDYLKTTTDAQCTEISLKLKDALQSFHSKGYAHMDIHTQNVLGDPTDATIHLIDVGLSEKLTDAGRQKDIDASNRLIEGDTGGAAEEW